MMTRALERLARRIRLLVSRGVVRRTTEAKLRELQVGILADETRDAFEHFEPFGMTARPLPGAEAIVLSVGGTRAHGVVVVVSDRRHRPLDLADGDVALYNAIGELVRLRGAELHLGAPQATDSVACASRVDARLTAIESALNDLIAAYNTHGHPSFGAAPTVLATPLTPGASTASSKVKVQP